MRLLSKPVFNKCPCDAILQLIQLAVHVKYWTFYIGHDLVQHCFESALAPYGCQFSASLFFFNSVLTKFYRVVMASICLLVCTLTFIEWRKFAIYVLFVTLSNALHLINLLMHLFLVRIVLCDIFTNLHLTALCQRLLCIWKHYVALAFVEVPQCISPCHSYIFAYRYLIFRAVSATGENVDLL